jgi:hypothetical protein
MQFYPCYESPTAINFSPSSAGRAGLHRRCLIPVQGKVARPHYCCAVPLFQLESAHPIQCPHCQTPRDNNGKSNRCASTASCGAARSAVTCGEVGSSNYGDRIVKRLGNIPQNKSTEANYLSGFTAENGAGAKGKVGEGERSSVETQTNDLSRRSKENRSGAAGTVGEGEGWREESGVMTTEPAAGLRQALVFASG